MRPCWPGRPSPGIRNLLALAAVLGILNGGAMAQTGRNAGLESPPGNGRSCQVCNGPIDDAATQVRHEGRTVWLHPGACLAHWRQDPQPYFHEFQARGALFDEESMRGSTSWGWFLFGLYVLLGAVSGALASYVAVTRGHPPIRWFFLGLAFSVIAPVAVLLRPPADRSGLPGGIPRGLRKVPTTRSPVSCPACGGDNHPAAGECLVCRASLRPVATAETSRI